MWVKMEGDLIDNPKLWKLCRLTGWDEDQAIGKLYRLWRWTMKHSETGNLSEFTHQDIARAINGTEESITHLITCRFLDTEPFLRIHDWHEYAMKYLQSKYSGTDNDDIPKRVERSYKSRKSNRLLTDGQQSANSDLDKIRFEKKRKSSKAGVKSLIVTEEVKAQETETASHAEPFPENGKNGHSPNDSSPQNDRAEIVRFIHAHPPAYCDMAMVDPDAMRQGHTLESMLRVYCVFGLKAAWLLFTQKGQRDFDVAKGRKFCIEEFLRQIPFLVDRLEYRKLRDKYQNESSKFELATVGL